MVLHAFHQRVDGLQAEAVVLAPVEGVGLVDEQHAAQGGLDGLLGEGRGVAHVLAHQVAPGDFHQLSALQHANSLEVPGDDAGHGGLACTGVAGEYHVHGGGVGLEAPLPAQLLDFEVILQGEDVVLHRLEAHDLGELLPHGGHGGIPCGGIGLSAHPGGKAGLDVLHQQGALLHQDPALHRAQAFAELLLAEGAVQAVGALL